MGTERDRYTLSWSVISHSSIIEYKLFYRQQPRHRQSHHQHRQEESNDIRRSKTEGSRVVGIKPEWNSVSIAGPGITNTNYPQAYSPTYPGVLKQNLSYTIQNLLSGTTYEVRVQAKNHQGWNKLSPVFHFTTRANDMENLMEPSAQPAVYGSNQGHGLSSNQIRTLSAYGLHCLCISAFIILN